MGRLEKYGKRRQITFRIGELAQERLQRIAELFNLRPSEYVKALLYKDLGIFNEPLDQRRRPRSHGVSTWEADKEGEANGFEEETPETAAEMDSTHGPDQQGPETDEE